MGKTKNYKTTTRNGFKLDVTAKYDDKRNWNVVVPTVVYNYLIDKVEETPPFKEFKTDIALYFLSLIISTPTKNKDKFYKDGFIPLDSRLLKKDNSYYNNYMNYFVEIGLLEMKQYSTTAKHAKSYRYKFSTILESEPDCIDFQIFELVDKDLCKSLYKSDSKDTVILSCPHLCKWFNENLVFDYSGAVSALGDRFCYNKYKAGNKGFVQALQTASNYNYSALMLEMQCFRFTRNPDSDNRLHTNLSNMPKVFRPFVTYDGESIVSLDVKNSQPYFLIYLLENINNEDIRVYLERIYDSNILCIMLQNLEKVMKTEAFITEFQLVKDAVLRGEYYELVMTAFPDYKANKDGLFRSKIYNKNKRYKELEEFEDLRSMIKKLSMRFLYTPLISPSQEYKQFKKAFPKLCECMEIFKTTTKDKESYKLFPKLLQHIEADFILDKITADIAREFPNMPLFTIHDSICTTKPWLAELAASAKKYFTHYTHGMPPFLAFEDWGGESKQEAA